MTQVAEQTLSIPVENDCAPINALAIATYNAMEDTELEDTSRNKQYSGLSKPGMTNNPAGRPKGSRSKLSEAFLADVHADWLDYGNQALTTMRQESPAKYCQMVMAILPKHIELDDLDGVTWVINASPRLTEDEWRQQHNLIESDT